MTNLEVKSNGEHRPKSRGRAQVQIWVEVMDEYRQTPVGFDRWSVGEISRYFLALSIVLIS